MKYWRWKIYETSKGKRAKGQKLKINSVRMLENEVEEKDQGKQTHHEH